MLPDRFVIVLAAAGLAFSTPAMGQNLYQDIQREFADENQLQRDVRRYQHDVSTGHYLRAAADRARISNDEANLRFDQTIVQNDLNQPGSVRPGLVQGQALVPHPQYPGYFYYPAQPGQLYYYPASQPVPPQAIASPTFVGPPSPANVSPANGPPPGAVGPNPVTFNVTPVSRTITVLISNPIETGVPVNFAVDGTAFSVPSGFTQKLIATTASIVEFDRGDLLGDGRYRLSGGTYEFRYVERGWELFKTQPRAPMPTDPSIGSLPRNQPPRGMAPAWGDRTAAAGPRPDGPSMIGSPIGANLDHSGSPVRARGGSIGRGWDASWRIRLRRIS